MTAKESWASYHSRVAQLNIGYVVVSFGVGWLLREHAPDNKLVLLAVVMLLPASYVALLRVVSFQHAPKDEDE